jgi:hypothetical protein
MDTENAAHDARAVEEAGPTEAEVAEAHAARAALEAGNGDAPAPGSVPAPDLEQFETPDDKAAALRAAGCVCVDPLTAKDVEREDACPIVGHGIAF